MYSAQQLNALYILNNAFFLQIQMSVHKVHVPPLRYVSTQRVASTVLVLLGSLEMEWSVMVSVPCNH